MSLILFVLVSCWDPRRKWKLSLARICICNWNDAMKKRSAWPNVLHDRPDICLHMLYELHLPETLKRSRLRFAYIHIGLCFQLGAVILGFVVRRADLQVPHRRAKVPARGRNLEPQIGSLLQKLHGAAREPVRGFCDGQGSQEGKAGTSRDSRQNLASVHWSAQFISCWIWSKLHGPYGRIHATRVRVGTWMQ